MHKKVITAGIFLSLIWIWVLAISRGIFVENGFYYDVPNKSMPTVSFLILFSIAFLLYFAVSIGIVKNRTDRKTFFAVIFFAILFRIILLPSIPIHENDIYRYIWDGKVALSGINPYAYAPQEVEIKPQDNGRANDFAKLKSLRDSNPVYFSRIGHRWVPTIYPPFAQAIFSLASFIRQDSLLLFKSIFVIFDILVIFILSKLLRFFNKEPSLCVIYAWSPLVLKEIANSGHYDSIPIFLTLLSLYFIIKNKALTGSISLACASLTKFYPGLLLPLFIRRIKVRHVLVFGAVFLSMYIPFFMWSHAGIQKVFAGLGIYSEKWAYNGSLFVMVQAVLDAFHLKIGSEFLLAKIVTRLIFITILFHLARRKCEDPLLLMKNALFGLVALFLLNPVGEPWYFCWAIPFLCFFPYRSLLLLSWLLIFSYLSFAHDFGTMQAGNLEIPILNTVQYVPFFVVLIWEFILRKRNAMAY